MMELCSGIQQCKRIKVHLNKSVQLVSKIHTTQKVQRCSHWARELCSQPFTGNFAKTAQNLIRLSVVCLLTLGCSSNWDETLRFQKYSSSNHGSQQYFCSEQANSEATMICNNATEVSGCRGERGSGFILFVWGFFCTKSKPSERE